MSNASKLVDDVIDKFPCDTWGRGTYIALVDFILSEVIRVRDMKPEPPKFPADRVERGARPWDERGWHPDDLGHG